MIHALYDRNHEVSPNPYPYLKASNRSPSYPNDLFQWEAKCEATEMKMIFNSHANQLIFTRKVLRLASL